MRPSRVLSAILPMCLATALLLVACGEEIEEGLDGSVSRDLAPGPDAEEASLDADGLDVAMSDGEVQDAGRADAGARDTGPRDTGPRDTGTRDAGTDPNVPADMAALLALMNEARAETNSAPLTWLPALADGALAWAEQCQWEHSPQNVRTYQGQVLGENLSAGSGNSWTPEALGLGWNEEKADYNCPNNSCAPGAVCGHYTQVIWRNSTQVGCAIHNCTTGSPFSGTNWRFLVCRYLPAGNFQGQRPVPVSDCP